MIFLLAILVTGLLTTYTDLKSKKIKNNHLILGAALGIVSLAYTATFDHENVLFHMINGLAGFVLGFVLYRTNVWKGGDAKLFALYAFLMPLPTYNVQPFPSVFSLFVCSFLGGSIILLPGFIKDILTDHKIITHELFLPAKRQGLFLGIGGMFYFTWVSFPLYYFSNITNPVIILTIMYLIFQWTYNDTKVVTEHYIIDFFKENLFIAATGMLFGFIMRFWLSPDSLSWTALTRYFAQIALVSFFSTFTHTILNHFKKYQERISFAPLIFIGCLLSYSPFLTWFIQLMHFVNPWT